MEVYGEAEEDRGGEVECDRANVCWKEEVEKCETQQKKGNK